MDLAKETTSLGNIAPGGAALIKKIKLAGPVRRRFMDMGLVTGARVQVIRLAPLGDPIEIKVKGYFLSLRKEDAERIIVEVTNEN